MRCSTCRIRVSKSAKFCANCGAILWNNSMDEIEWSLPYRAHEATSVVLKDVHATVIIRPDRVSYDVRIGLIAKPGTVRVIHTGYIVAVYTDPPEDKQSRPIIIIEAPQSTTIEIEQLQGSVHIDNLGQKIATKITNVGFKSDRPVWSGGKHGPKERIKTELGKY